LKIAEIPARGEEILVGNFPTTQKNLARKGAGKVPLVVSGWWLIVNFGRWLAFLSVNK
jgi:hypothetical protein